MLSRAKTLDGETVEGYYQLVGDINLACLHAINDKGGWQYTIDPSTLEYKIRDEWYSMEELEMFVKNYIGDNEWEDYLSQRKDNK